MRPIFLSIAGGGLSVLAWVASIWATSVNLAAEGPDTPLSALLATPIEWWLQVLSNSGASNLVPSVQNGWANLAVAAMLALSPFVVAASLAIYGIIIAFECDQRKDG